MSCGWDSSWPCGPVKCAGAASACPPNPAPVPAPDAKLVYANAVENRVAVYDRAAGLVTLLIPVFRAAWYRGFRLPLKFACRNASGSWRADRVWDV
jgi:hypothetical protein